jgi:hypothetical protein
LKTVYFDESGNLGFNFGNEQNSKHFVATFLIADKAREISLMTKKVFRTLRKKDMARSGGVLHSYSERRSTRIRLLSTLSKNEISIAVMKLNKEKFRTAKPPHEIYSDVASSLLARIYENGILKREKPVRMIASRMETKLVRKKRFEEKAKAAANSPLFTFEFANPSDEKGLQAVDFVSWALFRELEFGDPEYAEIIRGKIVGEYEYR